METQNTQKLEQTVITPLVICRDNKGQLINAPNWKCFERMFRIEAYKNGNFGKKLAGTLRLIADIDVCDPYYFYAARGDIKYIWSKGE